MLKPLFCAAAVFAASSVSFAAGLPARTVNGNYIEARTADVYTGPCFANGEVEQVGQEAVFGWKINNGAWQGVNVAGLSVVGVVRAQHTLGNQSEPVNPAKAVLIVDRRADAEQCPWRMPRTASCMWARTRAEQAAAFTRSTSTNPRVS